MSKQLLMLCMMLILPLAAPAQTRAGSDAAKILPGSWSGRVTGPQGGPPNGDVSVVFEKAGKTLKGKITVKAPGGAQYSGEISNIALVKKVFSATVNFKFGESLLETQVSGPLSGKTISGTFSVVSKGQKMGDGTFSIAKDSAAKPAK